MKILAVTNCPLDSVLGSGKTVIRYSEGLRALGHTVDVLQPKDYELLPGSSRVGIVRQMAGAACRIPFELRKNSYDIVEFYGGEFGPAVWCCTQMNRRPLLVAHTNGLELLHFEQQRKYKPPGKTGLKDALSDFIYRPLIELAFLDTDRFVSLCKLDRQFVVERGLYTDWQTAVVPPGLDEEFLKVDEPFKHARLDRVAYTGSWTARKGTDRLVAVMAEVLSSCPNVVFDVYGAHNVSDVVLSSFPDNVAERVVVHGPVTNQQLVEGLLRAKVFFFPSRYEGYGMAVAEAQACGCAVVTTPTGVGGELADGQEAIICEFDDGQRMKESIVQLLENDDWRMNIAQAGWRRSQGLTWQESVKELEKTYLRWSEEFK